MISILPSKIRIIGILAYFHYFGKGKHLNSAECAKANFYPKTPILIKKQRFGCFLYLNNKILCAQ